MAARLLTTILGLTFLWAAFYKAAHPQETLDAMRFLTRATPFIQAEDAVRALVAGEVVIGSLLVMNVGSKWTLPVSGAVLLLFTSWILYLIVTDSAISCGCGLKTTWLKPGQARWAAFARNIALLCVVVMAMVLYWSPRAMLTKLQPVTT